MNQVTGIVEYWDLGVDIIERNKRLPVISRRLIAQS
jgi:hypothetical protein